MRINTQQEDPQPLSFADSSDNTRQQHWQLSYQQRMQPQSGAELVYDDQTLPKVPASPVPRPARA